MKVTLVPRPNDTFDIQVKRTRPRERPSRNLQDVPQAQLAEKLRLLIALVSPEERQESA